MLRQNWALVGPLGTAAATLFPWALNIPGARGQREELALTSWGAVEPAVNR
jgi:hypothetical protein